MSSPVSGAAGLLIVVAGLLSACSGDDEGPVSTVRTGTFVDSAVEGLAYATVTGQGLTNAAGEFTYMPGESVTFSIGDIRLPAIRATELITPLDVFSTDDIMAIEVQNLSRLLQTLDEDGNPENGIRLTAAAAASAAGLSVDFASDEFDAMVSNLVANSGSTNTSLVPASDAIDHLAQTLGQNVTQPTGCSSEHPSVGRAAEFETYFHGVTGTLTVIDDCTIEISNFNYDGRGPQVYFYAGQNRDFTGQGAFVIGSQLNGQLYVDDTIQLTIEDGHSLDDFDSISVWCVDFQANFGDVFFGSGQP
jgi:hypothetical protein